MKLVQKLSISLFAATASVISFSSGAFAGEGAAAGSAAFTVDATTGNISGVAVAASVGKNDASASAFNDSANSVNSAFALGSANAISITGMTSATGNMAGSEDTALGDQINTLGNPANVQLGTVAGDSVVVTADETAP